MGSDMVLLFRFLSLLDLARLDRLQPRADAFDETHVDDLVVLDVGLVNIGAQHHRTRRCPASRLIMPSLLHNSSLKERPRVALRSSNGMVGNCFLAISAVSSRLA